MKNIEPAKENGRSPVIEFPMRGKKRKRIAPELMVSDASIGGSMQENIISLLAFGKKSEVRAICDSGLKPEHFESEVFRRLADESYKYIEEYGKAPRDHLPDLVEDCLSRKNKSRRRLYKDTLIDIYDYSKSLNSRFVLDSLNSFIRKQKLRRVITEAAEALQRGEDDQTYDILKKGLTHLEIGGKAVGPLPGILTGHELDKAEFPKVGEIVYPILQDPGILLMAGQFGVGKTMIALGLANAISAGQDFLGLDIPVLRSVLYMDLELAKNALQQRHRMISSRGKRKISYWSAANCYPAPKPNFADLSQIDALLEACDPFDVVFTDPISAGVSGVDMNTGEAWEGPLQFAMQRRHAGKSTVIVQHVGKDKSRGPRGSSRQEDFVDTSLMLEKIAGTGGDAAIRMTCRKLRNHPESDFTPMEIQLVNDGNRLRFDYQTLRESKSELVAIEYRRMLEGDLIKKGTQAALCREFNLDKSTVSRIASKVARKYREENK